MLLQVPILTPSKRALFRGRRYVESHLLVVLGRIIHYCTLSMELSKIHDLQLIEHHDLSDITFISTPETLRHQ